MPDRKGLVSGSGFCYLSVCRRSVSPCSGCDDVQVQALALRLVTDYLVKGSPCSTSTFFSVVGTVPVGPAKLIMVVSKMPCLQSATVYRLYRLLFRGWIFC